MSRRLPIIAAITLAGLLAAPVASAQSPSASPAPEPSAAPSAPAAGTSAAPSTGPAASTTPRPLGPPEATPIADPPDTPSGDGTGVRIHTDKGDIVIGLFTESSPVAAENFLNLVNAGWYTGKVFHRLVPGFVIQGGSPNGDGMGDAGYSIPDEPVVGRYGRGVVAMARSSLPNSQGSQFFVVLDDDAEQPLESARSYAIFGRVVEGMDVVDAIAAMPTANDEPSGVGGTALEPVTITGASIEQVILPPEPSPEPEPSFVGDAELAAMFPEQLGGEPVSVASFTGQEILSQSGPDNPGIQELVAALESQGKTLDDLTLASTLHETDNGAASIVAIRVKGAEAIALLDRLGALITGYSDLQTGPAEIGGKQVSVLTDGPDNGQQRSYGYANGEVLWIIQATQGLEEELLAALP
jgi:peptidyl-prolyl cis-trans isomerase B (cyclophilin B)